jgi:hypothetical protein
LLCQRGEATLQAPCGVPQIAQTSRRGRRRQPQGLASRPGCDAAPRPAAWACWTAWCAASWTWAPPARPCGAKHQTRPAARAGGAPPQRARGAEAWSSVLSVSRRAARGSCGAAARRTVSVTAMTRLLSARPVCACVARAGVSPPVGGWLDPGLMPRRAARKQLGRLAHRR